MIMQSTGEKLYQAIVTLLLTTILLSFFTNSYACSITPYDTESEAKFWRGANFLKSVYKTDLIFEGELIASQYQNDFRSSLTFKVHSVLKGEADSIVTVIDDFQSNCNSPQIWSNDLENYYDQRGGYGRIGAGNVPPWAPEKFFSGTVMVSSAYGDNPEIIGLSGNSVQDFSPYQLELAFEILASPCAPTKEEIERGVPLKIPRCQNTVSSSD